MERITMTVLGYEFIGHEGRGVCYALAGDDEWVEMCKWPDPQARTIPPTYKWTCDFVWRNDAGQYETRASGEGATPEDAMRAMVATADFQRILSTMNQLVERTKGGE